MLVGSVAGETHALPSAILADILRGAGFEVIDLGANTPPVSFAEAARRAHRLIAVLIGATVAGLDQQLADTIAAIRAAQADVPILVGGAAVDRALAVRLGADGWSGSDAQSRPDRGGDGPRPPADTVITGPAVPAADLPDRCDVFVIGAGAAVGSSTTPWGQRRPGSDRLAATPSKPRLLRCELHVRRGPAAPFYGPSGSFERLGPLFSARPDEADRWAPKAGARAAASPAILWAMSANTMPWKGATLRQ